MSVSALYDVIGHGYARQRRPDPRIAALLTAALGDAHSILNVGAGAGSYEPRDRPVVAVDPSAVMLAQREPDAAPAVRARAEALPFADGQFDGVIALLTLHHWTDAGAGLAECVRVARDCVVLLTWDPMAGAFWLVDEYFPAFFEVDRRRFPPVAAYQAMFGSAARVEVTPVPVPRDCVDGFLGAYWARPAAYLDAQVRAGISSFSRPGAERGLARLAADLASGRWHIRHGHLLELDALDLGYRLVVARLPRPASESVRREHAATGPHAHP